MRSTDPKCSSSFRDLVGPSPAVRQRASHPSKLVEGGEVTALAMVADSTQRPETPSRSDVTKNCATLVESMAKLRISAISFLNTAPLMWDFEHPVPPLSQRMRKDAAPEQFDISYTVPSACARSLGDDTADIGIIPAAAYTSI